MRYLRIPLFLILMISASSCIRTQDEIKDVLPYLELSLSDRNSRESILLEAGRTLDPQAEICFLGRNEDADLYASRFADYDRYDNVDGRVEADNLKDFAGETLTCVVEDFPYVDPKDSVAVELFRTKVAKSMISALDTLTYVSLYDSYGLGRRNSSKVFLLCSPEHSLWSAEDAEYMKVQSGAAFRVLSPLNESLDKIFSLKKDKALRLGLIYRKGSGSDPEIYKELFRHKAQEFGAKDAKCIVLASEPDSLLYRLLNVYKEGGEPRPLDAVIVDDFSLDVDALRLQQAEMVSIMNESSLTFGRMLSEDFEIYDTFEESVKSLYSILRQNNLFSHNISQPQILRFSPVERSDESGDSVILIPVSYVQN